MAEDWELRNMQNQLSKALQDIETFRQAIGWNQPGAVPIVDRLYRLEIKDKSGDDAVRRDIDRIQRNLETLDKDLREDRKSREEVAERIAHELAAARRLAARLNDLEEATVRRDHKPVTDEFDEDPPDLEQDMDTPEEPDIWAEFKHVAVDGAKAGVAAGVATAMWKMASSQIPGCPSFLKEGLGADVCAAAFCGSVAFATTLLPIPKGPQVRAVCLVACRGQITVITARYSSQLAELSTMALGVAALYDFNPKPVEPEPETARRAPELPRELPEYEGEIEAATVPMPAEPIRRHKRTGTAKYGDNAD